MALVVERSLVAVAAEDVGAMIIRGTHASRENRAGRFLFSGSSRTQEGAGRRREQLDQGGIVNAKRTINFY